MRPWRAAMTLAALCASGHALADPMILRAPVDRQTVAVMIGVPEISAGFWFSRSFGLSFEWRLPASTAGASLGTRWTLIGLPWGWGVDFNLAVGVVAPLISPGAGVSATPAFVGRWRNETFRVAMSVAAPAVVRVIPDPTLRLPLLFEAWFLVHVGKAQFGLQGAVGSTYVPGLAWSATGQVSLFLGWDL